VSSAISNEVRARVRARAGNRCGYCLSPQHLVLGPLEIEHVIPTAGGGTDDEDNLWLACRMCNNFKGMQTHALDPITRRRTRIFDPRMGNWAHHFRWNDDGTQVIGVTATGRATVVALQLNHVIAVMVRRSWVIAGWHPPSQAR
jgi:hypothetical protein